MAAVKYSIAAAVFKHGNPVLVPIVAPSGGFSAGQIYQPDGANFVCIAHSKADAGDVCEVAVGGGVYEVTQASAAVGDRLFADSSDAQLDAIVETAAAGDPLIGVVVNATGYAVTGKCRFLHLNSGDAVAS